MKRIVWLSVIFGLVACQQNPYAGKPDVGVNPPPREKQDPSNPKGAPSLDILDFMIFSEGQKSEYIVKGNVPAPGLPVVEFKNLPAGMIYDSAAQTLSWTPGFQAANDPADPRVVTRYYLVDVQLYSSIDPATRITRTVNVTVNDTPKPAAVKSGLEASGVEGQPLVQQIDFEDQEFPVGPFEVAISGLPADVQIDWPNHNIPSFRLIWNPGFDALINKAADTYGGHIVIYNPRGKRLEFNVKWSLAGRFSAPIVAGPTDITQQGNVDFMLMAEDLNGEFTPQWFITHPGYGTVTINTQAVSGSGGHPKSMGIVSWTNIPPDKLGAVVQMQVRACIQSIYCTTQTVRVLPTAMILRGKK